MAPGVKKSGKLAPNVSTAFGALKPKRKLTFIEDETEAAEKAIASENNPTGRKV